MSSIPLPSTVYRNVNGVDEYKCGDCGWRARPHFERHYQCNSDFAIANNGYSIVDYTTSVRSRISSFDGILCGAAITDSQTRVQGVASAAASARGASAASGLSSAAAAAARTVRLKPSERVMNDPAVIKFRERAQEANESTPNVPDVVRLFAASAEVVAPSPFTRVESIETVPVGRKLSFNCDASTDWRKLFFHFNEEAQQFICPGWPVDHNSPNALQEAAKKRGWQPHKQTISAVSDQSTNPRVNVSPLAAHIEGWHSDIFKKCTELEAAINAANERGQPSSSLMSAVEYLRDRKKTLYESCTVRHVKRTSDGSPKSQTIQELITRRNERMSSDGRKAFRASVAQLICFCDNAVPWSLASSKSFKNWMSESGAGQFVVGERRLGGSLLHEVADAARSCLLDVMQKWQSFSITTDAWTDAYLQNSYVAITFSGIPAQYGVNELQMIPLEVVPFNVSHTGEQLAEMLLEKVNLYTGDLLWYSATTDNGSNMVSACNKLITTLRMEDEVAVNEDVDEIDDDVLDEGGIAVHRCTDHTLDLVIRKVFLKTVTQAAVDIASVRAIVGRIRRSHQLKQWLAKIQREHFNRVQQCLVMDVCTRWNSIFFMIRSFVDSYDGIAILFSLGLLDNRKVDEDSIELPDRSVLQRLHVYVEILTEYEKLSRWLEGDQYLTMPFVGMWIDGLLRKADEWAKRPTDSMVAREIWRALSVDLHERFDPIFTAKNPVLLAAALNPYCGHLSFVRGRPGVDASPIKTSVWNELYWWLINGVKKIEIGKYAALGMSAGILETSLNQRLEMLRNMFESADFRAQWQLPLCGKELKSIFVFYEENDVFRELLPLVKMIVAAPASTGSSERLFSGLGVLKTLRRTRLDPFNLADQSVIRFFARCPYIEKPFEELCFRIERRRQQWQNDMDNASIFMFARHSRDLYF